MSPALNRYTFCMCMYYDIYGEVFNDIVPLPSFLFFQTYTALPKGGMVPEHVLILPIGHYAASTDAPPVSQSVS